MARVILLDTHIFMWWLADDERLSASHRRKIEGAKRVVVSAASYWEIATKHRVGKLPDGPKYLLSKGDLARVGVEAMPVDADDAKAAGLLEWEHQDPFDRMLVCQATHHRLRLVTDDGIVKRFLQLPG